MSRRRELAPNETDAVTMARNEGIAPTRFRRALRRERFSWHRHGEPWVVIIDRDEHKVMQRVLQLGDLRVSQNSVAGVFLPWRLQACDRVVFDQPAIERPCEELLEGGERAVCAGAHTVRRQMI